MLTLSHSKMAIEIGVVILGPITIIALVIIVIMDMA